MQFWRASKSSICFIQNMFKYLWILEDSHIYVMIHMLILLKNKILLFILDICLVEKWSKIFVKDSSLNWKLPKVQLCFKISRKVLKITKTLKLHLQAKDYSANSKETFKSKIVPQNSNFLNVNLLISMFTKKKKINKKEQNKQII